MRTRSELKALYLKARAFFQANPDKWGTGRMHDPVTGCMCYSGAMAHEEGVDPKHHNFTSRAYSINDETFRETRGSIMGINDKSKTLAEATAKLDAVFRVTA